jgi:hypothetical protein
MGYKVLVANSEGKISLGRRRCKYEDITATDIQVIIYDDVYCINLVQNMDQRTALLSSVEELRMS